MIEITHSARSHTFELVANGEVVRGPNGAGENQVRLGAHFRLTFQFPPMRGAVDARVMKSRLIAGQRQTVKIALPLPMSQGLPGTPVVDGAGQSGHSLAVEGLTPNYAGRVGWWLNVTGPNGEVCLHDIAAPFVADSAGKATIAISPALRVAVADGAAVELAHPVVVGFVEPQSWGVSTDFLSEFEVTVEEEI